MNRGPIAWGLIAVFVLVTGTLLYLAGRTTRDIDAPRPGSKLAGIERTVDEGPAGRSARSPRSSPALQEPVRTTPALSVMHANPATPLNQFAPVNTSGDFAALYFALTDEPVNYDRLASIDSYEYRVASDPFQKRALLENMTAAYKTKMTAYKGRYFYLTADEIKLGHYNLDTRSFPIEPLGGSWLQPTLMAQYEPTVLLNIEYDNVQPFKAYKVEDPEKAKAIEELGSGRRGRRARIYLFAKSIDIHTHTRTITAEVIRVRILGDDETVVAELHSIPEKIVELTDAALPQP